MLLKRLKLVNYGGIYNGLGLYEIEIDFTKCKNRIVLIKGDNGSGKSTIEGALKPLPDDNTSFINGMNACKEIEYIDEMTGAIYSIKYVHECKGMARTSKGYFYKTIAGNVIDLNPSGNISSCKEAVGDELELDSNYIALTQLSSTKRGIADLRPADRKRFVNNILSSTDVYNNMYKNLSKRASHFKSLMTNISSKIDSVGNIAQLEETLKSIEGKITEAENLIEQYTGVINKEQGMLIALDHDSQIINRIRLLTDEKAKYTTTRDKSKKELDKYYIANPNLITSDISQELLDKLNGELFSLNYEIKALKDKINNLIADREKDASKLEDMTSKLSSINSGSTIIELDRIKNRLKASKREIENRWGDIVDLKAITHDEFLIAYDIINSIAELITSSSSFSVIPQANINQIYLSTTNELASIESEIDDIVSFRNEIEGYEYKISILDQRPIECKDDTCPFIADALNAKQILEDYFKKRKEAKASMSKMSSRKRELEVMLDNIDINKQLIVLYNTNSIILKKLNLGLDTYESCINNIKNNLAETVSILNGLTSYSNDLIEYKSIDADLQEIKTKYDSLMSQKELINMITKDINELNAQVNADTVEIERMNVTIEEKTRQHSDMNRLFTNLTNIYSLRMELKDSEESLRIIDEELENNKSSIDKIEKLNSDIEKLTVNIKELKEQLDPLRKQAERIRYKLTLSVEYSKEYEEYNTMYSKIETLKYYCSPTTGIQLVFANMYLNKIMENANNILSKLFNGIFALLPLVITENEFRIPVAVNGGINHDDITSMSSAQIALISMIISISLLSQTSTKLNIIVGDEIDAPFDSENRREFINILTQLMSLVKSSQCVLISHNSEIPMGNCDVILLKNENDVVTEGNIIWSYR